MKPEDARIKYAEIISLPHHQSDTRQHMSMYARAAQFAPFAALSGYDDMVVEEARLTESEINLSEYEMSKLDQIIQKIGEEIAHGGRPQVTLTYFIPDPRKAGGRYETIAAIVKKIDTVDRVIVLFGSDNTEDKRISPIRINIDKIIDIQNNAVHLW